MWAWCVCVFPTLVTPFLSLCWPKPFSLLLKLVGLARVVLRAWPVTLAIGFLFSTLGWDLLSDLTEHLIMLSSLFPLGPHHAAADEVCVGIILFLKRIAVIIPAKIPVGLARDGIYTQTVLFLETTLWKLIQKLSSPDCHCSCLSSQWCLPSLLSHPPTWSSFLLLQIFLVCRWRIHF